MNKTIHILNGDSTAQILTKTSIKGDVVIWRELLCEGPLCKDVGSDEFWLKRYAYFENEIGISKLEYFDKTIKEIIKLEDLSAYHKVVLWFEYDLYCQVNLLALCVFLLKNFRKNLNYYLVCTGKVDGKDQLQSLSDFSPLAYKTLYEDKTKLTKNDLFFAEECWFKYVENKPEELQEFNFGKCSKFQYLQLAIDQHLKRFPMKNGLNQSENKILNIIDSEALTENEIIDKLLIWEQEHTVYGFGDLQYFLYLKKLTKYYDIKDTRYYLNVPGKSVILQE
jgi:hypothetical protein